MKILIEVLLSVVLLLLTAMPAKASTRIETVLPKLLYVPASQNGSQDLLVQEMFPSTCYEPAAEEVRIDFIAKRVYIADKAYHHKRANCVAGFMGYMKTISLGRLPAGGYELFFEYPAGNPQKVSTFSVQAP